ncbi:MAG: hypothetical protein R3C99_09835 [Pirellulaceae bacterium]
MAEAAEWGITQAAIDSVQQESDEFEWVVGFVSPDGLRAVDLLGVYKGIGG